jgi:hypothetical protein
MRLFSIEYFLEFLAVLDEELVETLEGWQFCHAIDLFIALSPFEIT